MDLGAVAVLASLAALGLVGWFAVAQQRFLWIWLSWTAFCLILFTLLVATRGQPTPRNFAIAWGLAPVVALLGWLRQMARMQARR